jgi:hypothetical protein
MQACKTFLRDLHEQSNLSMILTGGSHCIRVKPIVKDWDEESNKKEKHSLGPLLSTYCLQIFFLKFTGQNCRVKKMLRFTGKFTDIYILLLLNYVRKYVA